MFEFKNKTIEELRAEVHAFVGKEITLQGGAKVKLINVSHCHDMSIGSMTGVFDFQKNGEFDWNKGVKFIPMHGFSVTIGKSKGNGITWESSQNIMVPRGDKDDEQCLIVNSDESILKKWEFKN